ncbi:MAG: hypothetical protein RH917_15960 [Lacipirellulaceae bacterium]
MDVPPKDLHRIERDEIKIAAKFVTSLTAALFLLPPGGLLWRPGAAATVGGWFVDALLAVVS